MKFGKKIAQVAGSSKALCPPEDWMNYKHLKKLLKDIQINDPHAVKKRPDGSGAEAKKKEGGGEASQAPSGGSMGGSGSMEKPAVVVKKRADSIVESKYEKIFFSQLKQELHKVTNTFSKLEQQLLRKLRDFLPKSKKLKSALEQQNAPNTAEDVSSVIEECAELHFLFVCLESYAVINYAGFTKILKKHDKITGFTTRDKYMLRLVDEKPFAQHQRVKVALNAVTLRKFCELKMPKVSLFLWSI